MNRLKKYSPVTAQAYDPLCETTTAFDVTNKRLTRLIQPTQKAVRLISNVLCQNKIKACIESQLGILLSLNRR